jgi:hypothetical protein
MARPRTTKRSTIGNDPFDSVIPMYPVAEAKPVANRDAEAETGVKPEPKPAITGEAKPSPVAVTIPGPESAEGKQKLTVHLDADIVNRVKNAAYWNPRLTIAKIAERGIRLALREVEKENGGAYPQRDGDLVGGRPIK